MAASLSTPPAATPRYQKLPGRGRRGTAFVSYTRCRLWLGEDHLLNVDFTAASEEYKRFYFRDIEAFIIRRTATRQIWNWVFGVFLLLSAGPLVAAWRVQGEGGFLVAALAFGVFWGILLFGNTLRGPTCETCIRTAVQIERLPSLGRLPVARKILARIRPLIVAAQGAATSEELAGAPWMSTGATSANPSGKSTGAVRADKGLMHGSLFGFLILEAILTAVAFVFFREPITIFSMIALLGGAVMSVVTIGRQGGTDLPAAPCLVAKVALGLYVLKCLAGFVFMMIFAIRHPGTPMVTGLEMMGEKGFSETAAIGAALSALVGLIGLVTLIGHWRRRPEPPSAE